MWRWGDVTGPHFAEPVTVVRDDADGLVVWLAAGTPVLRKARADGLGIREDKATMFTAEVVQAETTWQGHDVLRIAPTGRAWSVWVNFSEVTHEFVGWYVNIEDPHTRDSGATYTRDRVLDLWVEPDRSHGRKDEDELVEAVRQGLYDEATAAWVTEVADEVEEIIEAWGAPFCDGWESFRPDPAWPIPDLR
jgi:predicted RNA-binding protein associated with RNAse of E/G family